MKILWLINIMLPQVAESLDYKTINSGGWLVTNSKMLSKDSNLVVLYPDEKDRKIDIDGVSYYGICVRDDKKSIDFMTKRMIQILTEEQPEVIHIWGTEHLHSYSMVLAANSTGMLDKVAVSIQGLVSVFATHYFAGLPGNVTRVPSLRDIIRRDSLKNQQEKLLYKGIYETKLLTMVHHVIGRTTWDFYCTKSINPTVNYHFNNETLRESFYTSKWNLESCQRHSIFVSQAQIPIKGFHMLLIAAGLLKNKYPDIQINVAGSNNPLSHGLKATKYNKYLYKLASGLSLCNRINYMGNLTEDEMCKQYLKAHVFVSPSAIENSPNSVGEAMLLGMPVVASYVGGTNDLLTDKKEGFLYPFDEPYMLAGYIDSIFSNDSKAIELGHNARTHAKKTHDACENYNSLLKIYKSIAP